MLKKYLLPLFFALPLLSVYGMKEEQNDIFEISQLTELAIQSKCAPVNFKVIEELSNLKKFDQCVKIYEYISVQNGINLVTFLDKVQNTLREKNQNKATIFAPMVNDMIATHMQYICKSYYQTNKPEKALELSLKYAEFYSWYAILENTICPQYTTAITKINTQQSSQNIMLSLIKDIIGQTYDFFISNQKHTSAIHTLKGLCDLDRIFLTTLSSLKLLDQNYDSVINAQNHLSSLFVSCTNTKHTKYTQYAGQGFITLKKFADNFINKQNKQNYVIHCDNLQKQFPVLKELNNNSNNSSIKNKHPELYWFNKATSLENSIKIQIEQEFEVSSSNYAELYQYLWNGFGSKIKNLCKKNIDIEPTMLEMQKKMSQALQNFENSLPKIEGDSLEDRYLNFIKKLDTNEAKRIEGILFNMTMIHSAVDFEGTAIRLKVCKTINTQSNNELRLLEAACQFYQGNPREFMKIIHEIEQEKQKEILEKKREKELRQSQFMKQFIQEDQEKKQQKNLLEQKQKEEREQLLGKQKKRTPININKMIEDQTTNFETFTQKHDDDFKPEPKKDKVKTTRTAVIKETEDKGDELPENAKTIDDLKYEISPTAYNTFLEILSEKPSFTREEAAKLLTELKFKSGSSSENNNSGGKGSHNKFTLVGGEKYYAPNTNKLILQIPDEKMMILPKWKQAKNPPKYLINALRYLLEEIGATNETVTEKKAEKKNNNNQPKKKKNKNKKNKKQN